MAFVITYEEYTHHYTDKRKAFKAALEAGIFTLIFFVALALILAVTLPFFI